MTEIGIAVFVISVIAIAVIVSYVMGYNQKDKEIRNKNRHQNAVDMSQYYIPTDPKADWRLKVNLDPQPGGGYTVTCDKLPALITEGDTLEEIVANVQDAFFAVSEAYDELGRLLPDSIKTRMDHESKQHLWLELDIKNTEKRKIGRKRNKR